MNNTLLSTKCTAFQYSLTLRKCKGRGEVPTIDVTYESFIAIVGVIFCKIVLGEMCMYPFDVAVYRSMGNTFEQNRAAVFL